MDRLDHTINMTIRQAVIGFASAALLVIGGNATGVLRHGDQAVIVTDTPRGTVNVRSIPVQRSGGEWGMGARLGRASEGQIYKFLEKRDFGNQGVWVRLEWEEGDAWISGRYLTQIIARDRLVVRSTTANIRNRATTNSQKIGSVKKGDVLGRVRDQDTWYLAELPSKKRGWIHKDLVKLEALAPAEKEPPQPKPAEPPPAEVDYRQLAQDALDSGNIDEAVAAYQKALEPEPNNGILHFELGKLFVRLEKPNQAIPHLRKAIRGRPARPEAEFTLKKLLDQKQASAAGQVAAEDEPTPDLEEPLDAGTPIFDIIADNAVYILPLGAIGSLGFIAVLVVIYRRRGIRTSQPSFRRRKPDGGFDDVLKYAVEKRPVIREIEEAEKKLTEMDEALAKRFASFEEKDEQGRPRLPPGESADRLLKRIDGLRKTIINQEERARIYSDLVMLQNEKISALDEEIEALKNLVQLDYQDASKRRKKAASAKKAVPPKATGD